MPIDFEDKNKSTLATTSAKLSTGKSAPLTRKAKADLAKTASIPEGTRERIDAQALQEIKQEILSIDADYDADEDALAIEKVNEVIPAFLQWRTAQSPDRVAAKTREYAKEVAEDWQAKFQSHSEELRRKSSESSAELLRQFTSEV